MRMWCRLRHCGCWRRRSLRIAILANCCWWGMRCRRGRIIRSCRMRRWRCGRSGSILGRRRRRCWRGANAGAYVGSEPQRFSYIDFVAHGVASRTDPLDSAIILSRTSGAEDSFKLYAREIMQHPIDARLVTIAACYGGGTRSYAGEGLVGLSWAFLRAGAHNVIGALWEVNDASTPLLMDRLYGELEAGSSPDAALRSAKLSLIHSPGVYRKPLYWGGFQLYAGS